MGVDHCRADRSPRTIRSVGMTRRIRCISNGQGPARWRASCSHVCMRLSAIVVAIPLLASAQIQDLATTADGGQTYFSTAYRLKGSAQPGYLKIFRIGENGLELFRQLDLSSPYSVRARCSPGF